MILLNSLEYSSYAVDFVRDFALFFDNMKRSIPLVTRNYLTYELTGFDLDSKVLEFWFALYLNWLKKSNTIIEIGQASASIYEKRLPLQFLSLENSSVITCNHQHPRICRQSCFLHILFLMSMFSVFYSITWSLLAAYNFR